jgi:hypothetical protein
MEIHGGFSNASSDSYFQKSRSQGTLRRGEDLLRRVQVPFPPEGLCLRSVRDDL